MGEKMRVAVLDDWQRVARKSADWTKLEARGLTVSYFEEPLGSFDAAAATLADFEFLVAMRERMAFPASLIARLKKLRMISLTGRRSPVLDTEACTQNGVLVSYTGGELSSAATAEIALGLLIGALRHMPAGDEAVRTGRFQSVVPSGTALEGRTLGVIGLGRIGARMARYGHALGMRVLGWSPNLTGERAEAAGAEFTTKEKLLAESDAVSLHIVLSEKTRGLLGASDLARMKPGAVLVNSSRFPLVDEAALIAALRAGRIVAALDVFPEEPLPAGHPLLTCPNTVFTPHLGYCVNEVYAQFYGDSIANILAFLDGKPIRMMNPEALQSRTEKIQ
jgi:phosphoglycerate dehydrogenase-like enzyme